MLRCMMDSCAFGSCCSALSRCPASACKPRESNSWMHTLTRRDMPPLIRSISSFSWMANRREPSSFPAPSGGSGRWSDNARRFTRRLARKVLSHCPALLPMMTSRAIWSLCGCRTLRGEHSGSVRLLSTFPPTGNDFLVMVTWRTIMPAREQNPNPGSPSSIASISMGYSFTTFNTGTTSRLREPFQIPPRPGRTSLDAP